MKLFLFLFVTVFTAPLLAQEDKHSPRWRVKTLSDRDTVFIRFDTVIKSSVREQAGLPLAEVSNDTRRLASETLIYEVRGMLVGVKRELDGDYHLVVQDPDTTAQMIMELPNPNLEEVILTGRADLYREARRTIDSLTFGSQRLLIERFLETPIELTFTGVGFYDTWHLIPQAGMPKNRRELHPVLSVKLPGVQQ